MTRHPRRPMSSRRASLQLALLFSLLLAYGAAPAQALTTYQASPRAHGSSGLRGPGAKAPRNANPRQGLSDFNGDGFADLAVGTPSEDVGSIGQAGAVNVVYGSATVLQAT